MPMPQRSGAGRTATSTSDFGVGKRENHDASGFYARFTAPEISGAGDVAGPVQLDEPWIHGDIRERDDLPNDSVALVVTSPPYFAGKAYEAELGADGVPASYIEYLDLLRTVFERCAQKLEPGGRIAVNVANLGRKPYRSLASDVVRILQDDLRLLLRGEIVWKKADGAGGNCAWGSFRSPANPVLRDTTERVIVASKGRFDRAIPPARRRAEGLPSESTITNDEFLEATLDLWEIPPERATRVNHPAPFPVELPERLIHLFTYKGDLVLDPFMGSGTTLVAAARTGRCYLGYDVDERYCRIAQARVAEALTGRDPAAPAPPDGATVQAVAEQVVAGAGFEIVARKHKVPRTGTTVDLVARDAGGGTWYFDVTGAFTSTRAGLARSDVTWKSLGRISVVKHHATANGAGSDVVRYVLLTSHLPKAPAEAHVALHAAGPSTVFDALEVLSPDGQRRLAAYARGDNDGRPLPGFWTDKELSAH